MTSACPSTPKSRGSDATNEPPTHSKVVSISRSTNNYELQIFYQLSDESYDRLYLYGEDMPSTDAEATGPRCPSGDLRQRRRLPGCRR